MLLRFGKDALTEVVCCFYIGLEADTPARPVTRPATSLLTMGSTLIIAPCHEVWLRSLPGGHRLPEYLRNEVWCLMTVPSGQKLSSWLVQHVDHAA